MNIDVAGKTFKAKDNITPADSDGLMQEFTSNNNVTYYGWGCYSGVISYITDPEDSDQKTVVYQNGVWISDGFKYMTFANDAEPLNGTVGDWFYDNFALYVEIEDLYLTEGDSLQSVANAIRAKGDSNSPLIYPGGFITAINNIETDPLGIGIKKFDTYQQNVKFSSLNIPDSITSGTIYTARGYYTFDGWFGTGTFDRVLPNYDLFLILKYYVKYKYKAGTEMSALYPAFGAGTQVRAWTTYGPRTPSRSGGSSSVYKDPYIFEEMRVSSAAWNSATMFSNEYSVCATYLYNGTTVVPYQNNPSSTSSYRMVGFHIGGKDPGYMSEKTTSPVPPIYLRCDNTNGCPVACVSLWDLDKSEIVITTESYICNRGKQPFAYLFNWYKEIFAEQYDPDDLVEAE